MATDTRTPSAPSARSGDAFINTNPDYPPLYRLTVEQYHRICEAGIVPEGAPVELMEGLLVQKMGKNQPHIVGTMLLERILPRMIPDGWSVTASNPVTLEDQGSEPEPDCQVIRGSPRDFLQRKPDPTTAALVIEVSDTSYRYDRHVKWANYAASGVPVYWIVDLNRRRLEVHTDPSPEGYRSLREFGPDDEVPIVLDGREVARLRVAEILP